MNYKLELKPFEQKDGVMYKIIKITDIALHSSKKILTPSVGRKIDMAFKKDRPDRIYQSIQKNTISDSMAFVIDLLKNDPDFIKMIKKEETKGFKVLIELPKEGIPVSPGEDTVEFMNSKNGKRILRALAKNKPIS